MKNKFIITGQPIVKKKSFCPNPIVKYGIPDYADSASNPKVIGTTAWRDWWEEQIDYCINGYDAGGLWIPGRYYYYLNFFYISTVGVGNHHPMFVDFDYDFFMLVEHVKNPNVRKGIISLKRRRIGLSFKVSSIFDHGFRFRDNYTAGICAGEEKYAIGLYKKFLKQEGMLPPELRVHKLRVSNEEIVAGFEEKTDTGYVKKGSKNTVLVRTMFRKPNVFEGELLDDCVFEEAGIFSLLGPGFDATEPCFAVGNEMRGTPFVYGTGGDITTDGKKFLEMWSSPEEYNLVKFWAPGRKMYFPAVSGYRDEKGRIAEDIPYLKEKYPRSYERVGMQDEKRADELIDERRLVLSKGNNKKKYYKFIQQYPKNAKEAMLKFSSNNYDSEALSNQTVNLMKNELGYGEYILEYEKDKDGNIITPYKVTARPAIKKGFDKDDPDYIVKIRHDGHPLPKIRNLDIGGIDGYDIDKTSTSKSLGSTIVMRRRMKDIGIHKRIPVCLYNDRPKRKEIFYEVSFKITVYYNLISNVMIDVGSPLIIRYFENNGGTKYLSPRPRSMESERSEQQHKYGMRFTNQNRPIVESMIQTYIIDEIDECVFPEMIRDFMEYEQSDSETDCDNHDAWGLCLSRERDIKADPIDRTKIDEDDPTQIVRREIDEEGNIKTYHGSQNKRDTRKGDLFSELVSSGYYNR